MKKKAALHNLGCKVNAYEVDAMQQLLEQAGYEIVPFQPGADVYVINTCTVTNIADRKSRQMLHKAKKMNPEAIVVATGCYAQTGKENLDADEAVDLILGNNRKKNLVEALEEYERERRKQSDVIEINETREYETLSIQRTAEHVRAYLKVQDGCNQFCSYCIIPYARGRVRSREIPQVIREVEALSKAGYQEVVLTGIHLSSYGADFPEEKRESLLSLIKRVHQVEGIRRIRLGSLEPRVVTEEFAREIAGLPKVCPHFHLSLQSGCDETLKRMNRRYDSGQFRESCRLLRSVYDRPALTTDIIVGFPMESQEEFEASLDFVDSIGFYETHVFKYSRRQGTRAAAMEGQVSEQVKGERSDRMLALHHRHARDYESSLLGRTLEVLLEEEIQVGGQQYLVGHSREYVRTAIEKGDGWEVNDICRVQAEGFLEEHTLLGKAIR
ncbi:MAG: tRNA (N(6)-L-threonylcarbamoyladenosine(37)-C(2))-methylthiotransferase MtaB [Eubacteriales bacterium]|nr:tRNA (N(6)-L-threonylcarbamoyladenosine(37)-C(2))-methylthiotransferase MtaB [Eubacteriales bacterium]